MDTGVTYQIRKLCSDEETKKHGLKLCDLRGTELAEERFKRSQEWMPKSLIPFAEEELTSHL